LYNYLANTQYIGKRFLYLTSCHSTSDLAKNLDERGLTNHGMVILAEEQTRGRGQQGNVWQSNPHENLTFTLVLKPQQFNIRHQFLFNKVISIHLLVFFRSTFPEHAHAFHIKWPNDLYFYDRKIAGLLIENALQGEHIHTSVVGIGLNVNQTSFDLPQASSLALGLQRILAREALLHDLLTYLDENLPTIFYFSDAEVKTIEHVYDTVLWKYQKEHTFKQGTETFKGIIQGVNPMGQLLIEKEGNIQAFDVKTIQFLNNTGN
jgi:BirA family transcriptional regulator, biotin operon repressor / biotin---[acetyl-CoA-carboxylase] ligase